ncbi:MAG: Trm112 family protein [Fimbriimonas ginsengisoli]|uniref:Trm112 family protein n=1 Tax=Fimbriimonas ginsengisoli TaxID=1005039 RepID=A0A931PTJ1_FIMGI|nr:Trm112 family protein [Fimbriimonas ginsengisoli]
MDDLACPVCPQRPPLFQRDNELVCRECGRVYPVVDGIPRLTPDQSEGESDER